MTFGVWLRRQPPGDPDLDSLQDFAGGRSTLAWPYHSSDLGPYVAAVGTHPDESRRTALLDALGRAYQRWLIEEGDIGGMSGGWRDLLGQRVGTILLTVFGLVVAVALASGIFKPSFLDSLAADGTARGLITFLFSMSTIAIILLAAIAVFWVDQQELKDRFGYAKDLVTVLIGVLGTIMGFYFGSAVKEQAQVAGPASAEASAALPEAKGGTVPSAGAD